MSEKYTLELKMLKTLVSQAKSKLTKVDVNQEVKTFEKKITQVEKY